MDIEMVPGWVPYADPFFYTSATGMVDLFSLVPPDCPVPYCIYSANAINDAGQITGGGPVSDPRAVLFSPVASSFSPFEAKLQFIGKGQTHFRLRGNFTLGTDSTGLDPLTQQVLLQLDSLPIPIQKGLFSQDSKRDYMFQGVVGSAAIDFRIKRVTNTTFKFEVEGLTGTPLPLSNPARFIFMVGNNKTMGTLSWK